MEDFAILLGKSPEEEGENFKYNASCLDMVRLIKQYTAASPAVLMEFFRLMIYNYLIVNGDTHLKNFSLMETAQGDHILSPAYDLICTKLHIDDDHLALYDGDYEEHTYHDVGMYTGTSFLVFAQKAEIPERVARLIIGQIIKKAPEAIGLVQRSFLSLEANEKYISILDRRQQLLIR